MRLALIWTTLAIFGFLQENLSGGMAERLPESPLGWTPFVALALGQLAHAVLKRRPIRKRIFGTSGTLRVVLPGLLVASGLAAFMLERRAGAALGDGLGFVLGAAAGVGLVMWLGLMRSAPPRGVGRVRYVCARCGIASDRDEGRAPCAHCGLVTRIDWTENLPESAHGELPLTRLWCPSCAHERMSSRGTSACEPCGQALHLEFNDHATGALGSGDGRGLEAR